MSFNDFYKRFVAFGIAFAFSLFAAAYFYGVSFSGIFKQKSETAPKIAASENNYGGISRDGNGTSGCCDTGDSEINKMPVKPVEPTKGVKILSKPRADYTVEARANNVQGKVVLRVVFTASGKIGGIFPVKELPDGLTEQAIAAAKGIKFKPAMRGGVPYSVTKPVEYTFTVY